MEPLENESNTLGSAFLVGVGARLREARERLGLSQIEVAARSKFTTRSITRWEHGVCDPGIEEVWVLSMIYQVSIDWLAGSTSVRSVVDSGRVVVDDEAIEVISMLASNGGTIC